MSEPIKPGDLVVVIRDCPCDGFYNLGRIFKVDHINPLSAQCKKCGFAGELMGPMWREESHCRGDYYREWLSWSCG